MDDRDFTELLGLGYERPGVEFKGPGSRTNLHFRARVVRAVLGMANRRDGGYVVLGVEESGDTLRPIGLDEQELATWSYDDIAASLAEYADPSVTFDMEVRTYAEARFVVLRVHEFDEVPVLCGRDYPRVLRKGACYVRSRRKPETSEIPSQEDMRALLDLAVDKGVQKWVARTRAAGLLEGAPAPSTRSEEELFRKQAEDLI